MALPAAAYSNLALFPASPKGGAARKLAAVQANDAELTLKRNVERANTLLDRLEAREAAFAAEIKAIQKRKTANAARIAKIEDSILGYMDEAGVQTLAGVRCSMRLQPAAASLVVVDQSLIPAEYLRTPKVPPAEPDKVLIKKALAANEDLDPAAWGCKLVSTISLIRK
jgi:Gp157 protein